MVQTPRGALSAEADKVVDTWLSQLPRVAERDLESPDLREGYRSLARAVLGQGLATLDATAQGTEEWNPDFDGILARLTAATRKAGLSIGDLLEDLGHLTPLTISWLQEELDHPSRGHGDLLRVTTRQMVLLHGVAGRLVRLLEASAARARREHAEALTAMTHMLSHELKNRLGAARTASQILVTPDLGLDRDGLERAAELVRSSVDAALRTVDDVRTLASSRTRIDEHITNPMLLPGLVGAIVEPLATLAEEQGVAVELDGTVPDCWVDAPRLRLVAYNLVGNGIKYHDPERDTPRVRIAVEELPDGRVEVRVTDNGVGIPPGEIGDIFAYRARGSHTNGVSGSGLGLAITAEAVAQMGGEISVESRVGVGTTFTVRVPSLAPPEKPI